MYAFLAASYKVAAFWKEPAMPPRFAPPALTILLAALLACGSSSKEASASSPNAGSSIADGGVADAGLPVLDAGVPADAGTALAPSRPLDPQDLAQFITPLPIIPAMVPDTTTVPGSDFYVVTAMQGEHDFGLRSSEGMPLLDPDTGKPIRTLSWGYGGSYLGATIEARSTLDPGGRPVVVRYVNALAGEDGRPLVKHLFQVDTTVDGAHEGMPEVRTVPHLHGGHVAAEFDGHPEYWFTNDPTAPANGMGGPAGNTVDYAYANDQPASTLWFHDHAMGVTRLNVYAGLAAFYLVRDAAEDALRLPSGAYEIPLVLQDKSFREDGSLAYDTIPLIDPYTGMALLDRSGVPMLSSKPETFGNAIVVNGVVWPYLDVEPRKYRFRMVNGSDSRFYNLWVELEGTGPVLGLAMAQIGSEGGLLPAPVLVGAGPDDGLLLGNGERADLVLDFSALAGKTVVLRNDAATPFPDGDPVNANTTGKIMQFRVVKPLAAPDASALPVALRAHAPLAAPSHTRVVDLQERTDIYFVDDGGVAPRLELRLNGLRFRDPVTETPRLGAVEDWIMVNTTVDMHPMHLHLVAFEVLEKGSYDPKGYRPAAGGVMGVLQPGALHPNTDLLGKTVEKTDFDPGYTVAANEVGLKDTVRVPPGGYVRIRAHFDRPGEYMWHCHILAHEEHSMMRPFRVMP